MCLREQNRSTETHPTSDAVHRCAQVDGLWQLAIELLHLISAGCLLLSVRPGVIAFVWRVLFVRTGAGGGLA